MILKRRYLILFFPPPPALLGTQEYLESEPLRRFFFLTLRRAGPPRARAPPPPSRLSSDMDSAKEVAPLARPPTPAAASRAAHVASSTTQIWSSRVWNLDNFVCRQLCFFAAYCFWLAFLDDAKRIKPETTQDPRGNPEKNLPKNPQN